MGATMEPTRAVMDMKPMPFWLRGKESRREAWERSRPETQSRFTQV